MGGNVARMKMARNVNSIIVGKLEGKRKLSRSRRKWEIDIKMCPKK